MYTGFIRYSYSSPALPAMHAGIRDPGGEKGICNAPLDGIEGTECYAMLCYATYDACGRRTWQWVIDTLGISLFVGTSFCSIPCCRTYLAKNGTQRGPILGSRYFTGGKGSEEVCFLSPL